MNAGNAIIFFLLLIVLVSEGRSQSLFFGKEAGKIVPHAASIRIDDRNSKPDFIRINGNIPITENTFDAWIRNILAMDKDEKFVMYRKEKDHLGFVHARYQLYYENIPVEASVFIGHFDKKGWLVSANGFYRKIPQSAILSPVLSEQEALAAALLHVGADIYQWQDERAEKFLKFISGNPDTTYYPKGRLVFFPDNGNYSSLHYKLSYKFDIYSEKPLKRLYVFVDAEQGAILRQTSRIHTVDSMGTAITKYSGAKGIIADKYGSTFRLRESGRGGGIETYNMMQGSDPYTAVDFTDNDNYWNNINVSQDETATDAHWGAEMTYDFFYNSFSRSSYDGAGAKVLSYVHYDIYFANAFWDGAAMNYGDGDDIEYAPFTPIDVVGHEFGHGVTEYTANLDYYSESGALNESFSDIFGTAVEYYAKPATANFLVGEEMMLLGGAIRSMQNPNLYDCPDTYSGDFWDPYEEVHINSGVQNFWFYLLSMGGTGVNDTGNTYIVSGIGIDKAVQIAYRTLSVYLTPYSNYSDARTYSVQAATDLFGACSAEVSAAENAWYAVGVGSISTTVTTAGFSSDITYSCSLPVTINFSNTSINADDYSWDFGDGGTSTAVNPSHTYSTAGTYDVQLIASGAGICNNGTDTLIKTGFIAVADNNGPSPPSCEPGTANPGTGVGIYNVTFLSINNSSPSGDGFKDYSCQFLETLTAGSANAISVTTGPVYEEDVSAWIDYNNNNAFSASELVFTSVNTLQYHAGNITIPGNTALNMPLRMRIGSDYSGSGTLSPCTNSWYGQFEDYAVVIIPEASPPIANFSFLVTNECGGIVQFYDLSTVNSTSWLWNFGDGTAVSSLQNPSHTFTFPGTFTVTLSAANIYGADSAAQTITVNPMVVDFNSPDTAFQGVAVYFTDIGTSTISWLWDFGDGYGAAVKNPVHTYAQPGIYQVEMTASDTADCTGQKTKTILINDKSGMDEIAYVEKIVVFPNPSNGIFKINAEGEQSFTGSLTIQNVLGKTCYSSLSPIALPAAMDFSYLPSGFYFLKIKNNEIAVFSKVMIE